MALVYKYLPSERLSYLNDELLRITQPGDLNDPFECIPVPPTPDEIGHILKESMLIHLNSIKYKTKSEKNSTKNLLERKLKSELTAIKNNSPGNFRDHFIKQGIDNINRHIGILSLSRRWNSSLMWAHYTNSHRGFCIGFDSQDSFFKDYAQIADTDKIYMPVLYSNNRIKVPIIKGERIDIGVMFTKSKEWEYEHEERLLISLNNAHKKIPSIPLDIYLYRIPHYLIKEIIVGANISDEDFKTVHAFAIQKDIPLYKSIISLERFDMDRKSIV